MREGGELFITGMYPTGGGGGEGLASSRGRGPPKPWVALGSRGPAERGLSRGYEVHLNGTCPTPWE